MLAEQRIALPASAHVVAVALPQSLVPMQPMLGKVFHRLGWMARASA